MMGEIASAIVALGYLIGKHRRAKKIPLSDAHRREDCGSAIRG
jgi:hypothetical protein